MTNQELENFLVWLRSRYVLARIIFEGDRPGGRLLVESIANQAVIEQYRKHEADG